MSLNLRRRRGYRVSLRAMFRRNLRTAPRRRWRAPDQLAIALAACSRLMRANRRLARLAPSFLDPVVEEREARELAARREWDKECDAALEKVYGPSSTPAPTAVADLPPLPGLRTQRAVDAQLALRQAALSTGSLALERWRTRSPHAIPSLSQLARLLWTAVQMGRWAAGMPDEPPEPEPPPPDPWEDLRRAYGDKPSPAPAPAAPGLELQPVVAPVAPPPVPSTPASSPAPSPAIAPASPATPGRRDAWSSWARTARALARRPPGS